MVSAPARRQQVAYVRQRGVSERRACALMSVARSALRYESRLMQKDAPVLAAMSILSAQYPRYGYRRIHVFLERQGHRMSIDRAWRLWQKGQRGQLRIIFLLAHSTAFLERLFEADPNDSPMTR